MLADKHRFDTPATLAHLWGVGTVNVKLKSNGGYWLAYWSVPGERGKRRGKSLGPKSKMSKRMALGKCRQLADDMAAGKISATRAPRLSEWIDAYTVQISGLRTTTRALYRVVSQYLKRHFDHDPRLDEITPNDAVNWRVAMASGELSLDNKNITEAPGETTVCKHVRSAKAIFNAAVKAEIINRNPFRSLKGNAPSPARDWRHITPEDMAKILDACPNDSYRALFALCRWVGLRRDEARDLKWTDILWDKNRIAINTRVVNPTTKGHPRIAPVEPRDNPTGLAKLLRDWYDHAPEGTYGPCHAVHKHNLYPKLKAIMKDAGIVYGDPCHTLRKCWETELALKYPLHVVVAWLGNTFEVARKHYLRVPDELYGDATSTESVPVVVINEGKGHRAVKVKQVAKVTA